MDVHFITIIFLNLKKNSKFDVIHTKIVNTFNQFVVSIALTVMRIFGLMNSYRKGGKYCIYLWLCRV